MKKWMVLLVVLLGIALLVTRYLPDSFDYKIGRGFAQERVIDDKDEVAGKNEILVDVSKSQIYQGDLLLINKDYPLVDGNEAQDIVKLVDYSTFASQIVLLDRSLSLSQDVAERFLTMVKDANVEGIDHFMASSGYRTNQEQDNLYDEKGSEYAMPAGYSEHNLGLALDVGSTQSGIEKSEEGVWLRDNAWKYGFILRYPKNKEKITSIKYEPWHFRYIGLPHSAIMEEHDMVLEEYYEALRDEPLSITIEGQHYNVRYHPMLNDKKIAVPADGDYTISGNNVDGVIVTERHR
ncbi:M15 family metallopeptidase [Paenibacillus sp. PsM32]|uniref:M15 family metallopeptidase n=1 Tax=Paenibacillus sp. PsM32 TaxID=3030536 RepID=UPI00263BB846|nr:M15 family metallopeptidase [Paenibacillus sp. PsM32]MDN4617392.1 M15 family metallopeptidase [Paenibacillus sp. PsM32]